MTVITVFTAVAQTFNFSTAKRGPLLGNMPMESSTRRLTMPATADCMPSLYAIVRLRIVATQLPGGQSRTQRRASAPLHL